MTPAHISRECPSNLSLHPLYSERLYNCGISHIIAVFSPYVMFSCPRVGAPPKKQTSGVPQMIFCVSGLNSDKNASLCPYAAMISFFFFCCKSVNNVCRILRPCFRSISVILCAIPFAVKLIFF